MVLRMWYHNTPKPGFKNSVIPGATRKRGNPEPMDTGLWNMDSGFAAGGAAPE
jgi:hypothetical protein